MKSYHARGNHYNLAAMTEPSQTKSSRVSGINFQTSNIETLVTHSKNTKICTIQKLPASCSGQGGWNLIIRVLACLVLCCSALYRGKQSGLLFLV